MVAPRQRIITPTEKTGSFSILTRMLRGKAYADSRFFIIVDSNTFEKCMPLLVSEVSPLQFSDFFEVEAGEACKDIDVVRNLWEALLDSYADRNSVIVNLGGGSVCDLGGFVAATFKRGLRYINVPTSLLAMVDAAVGGKTAVNVGGLKNQVGCFHMPQAVCIEPEFLHTLPEKEMTSGVFEMLKTFAVSDKQSYLAFLEELGKPGFAFDETLIYKCAMTKAEIVRRDFRDEGVRRCLNFGHTLGHAIESFSLRHDTTPLTHGEAVGLGMVSAMWLSAKKCGLDMACYTALRNVVEKYVHGREYSKQDLDELVDIVNADKKIRHGIVQAVLLSDIGAPAIDVPLTKDEIREGFFSIFRG